MDLLDLVIEGQADILAGVHPCCRVERPVPLEPFHHLFQSHTVLRPEFDTEALVQFGDDPRQGLDLFLRPTRMDSARPGINGTGAP